MLDLVQNDDKSGSCRQQLGTAGIFTSDLIPLLEQKIDDDGISHKVEGGLSIEITHEASGAGTHFVRAKIV